MESKIVPLNPVPDHPKYLRLPSLSRSLVHSILPKDCQAMHTKPIIFSVSVKPSSPEGAPKLSSRKRRPGKQVLHSVEKPVFIRPNSPSYVYKKMFLSKEEPVHAKPKYYKSSRGSKEASEVKTSYFCEISSKEKRESLTPLPEYVMSATMNIFNPSSTIKRYYRNGESKQNTLMKNISEARSSQESSEESLKYFHIKQSSL